ncbi:hypothetical protein C8Q77DRAFT_1156192 [Trametes polyzona]|nr:hypothetical protein C8Q77DRAFT_1156192 [Trametes polyzona]
MLSKFLHAFVPRGFPSAIVVVGEPQTRNHLLHIMPESGDVECCSTGHIRGDNSASACAKEKIGDITTCPGDYDTMQEFVRDVEERALERWQEVVTAGPSADSASADFLQSRDRAEKNKEKGSSSGWRRGYMVDVDQLVDDILRPAALDAIREWELKATPTMYTQPVFIVRVKRSEPGRVRPWRTFQ